ncbi:MAG: hypothetical protein AB7E72_04060 [Lysobacterales bacterium]
MRCFLVALSLTLLCIAAQPVGAADAAPDGDVLFSDSFEAPSIRLRGVASFTAPLAFANVTLTGSDGLVLSSTADAEGRFEFTLEGYAEDEVFDVRARGEGAQSWLEFAAWLGDGAFLREMAGPEGIIDTAALPALHVNPHQTGRYLAIRDLPPSPINVDRPAQRAAASFSSNDATIRGALVALLADGAPMPAGAATTLQAVGELPLAIELVESLGGEFICYINQPESPECIALARVVRDPTQVPLASPPTDVALHPYTSFEVGANYNYPRLFLSATGNGQLSWTDAFFAPAAPVTWSTLPSGEVRVVHRDGLPLRRFLISAWHQSCGCGVWREVATMAALVQFVRGPMGTLAVGVVYETEYRYPDNPEIPPETVAPYPLGHLTQVLVDDRPLNAIPVAPGDSWVLPHCMTAYCLGAANVEGAETHDFHANGTGVTRRTQLAFQWSLSPLGDLLIEYSDGAKARHALASADRVAVTSASVQVGASGDILALSQPIMHAEARGFDAADLIGFEFRSLRSCERPFAEIEIVCRSTGGYSFATGGSGANFGSTLSWSIDAQGRLIFLRYRPNGSISQRRVWERIAEVGDTLYVLEQIETPPLPTLDYSKPAGLMAYRKKPFN